jgi:tetrahydromethanopterin S-methyltransferase subunit H
VFYYGPEDTSVTLAGNAPFIVDRKDGSIHVTGTAYPPEVYLQNYALTGTAFPPGVPEHTVVLKGWKPGSPPFPKISLTKAIRANTGKGLAESKACTDSVLSGEDVALMFPTAAEADKFSAEAQRLGASIRRGIR